MLGGLCPVCEWAFVAAIAATQQATSMTLTPVPSRQSSRSGEELYKEAKGAFQLQITPSPFFIILSHQTIEHRLKTLSRRLHCFQVAVWKEIPALHGWFPGSSLLKTGHVLALEFAFITFHPVFH